MLLSDLKVILFSQCFAERKDVAHTRACTIDEDRKLMGSTLDNLRDNETICIRTDASTQIGTGHVMRCLAFAQAWRESGGQVTLATALATPTLEPRFQAENARVVHLSAHPGSVDDAAQTVAIARQRRASWVIVDGYHFDADYQRCLKDAGLQLLVIDDHGYAKEYWADVILNQNLHAHDGIYAHCQPNTRLLLGTRYVLLRREFLQGHVRTRQIPTIARKLLITLGGSDAENVTAKVLQALPHLGLDGLETVVVIGGSNPHVKELHTQICTGRLPVHLERNVANLANFMAWADIAVTAAGSTVWESACLGLPSLVIVLAENQRPIAEQAEKAGTAINLGWHADLTAQDIARKVSILCHAEESRRLITQRGPYLVDGYGTDRIVMTLQNSPLRVRKVYKEDCRLLWEWANDPSVRTVSFGSAPIPWEEHQQWFHTKITDPYCRFYLAVDDNDIPTGQVRYDLADHHAVVSISMDQQRRGKGHGSTLLHLSAQTLFATTSLTTIYAYIKPHNPASVRAFEKAGYKHTGTVVKEGQHVLQLTLQRREQGC